jgi:hypothetical protein
VVTDRGQVNEAFFKKQMSDDCASPDAAKYLGVVRIKLVANKLVARERFGVLTGTAIDKQEVVTFLPVAYRDGVSALLGATVQIITCGKVQAEAKVSTVKPLVGDRVVGGFVRLGVEGADFPPLSINLIPSAGEPDGEETDYGDDLSEGPYRLAGFVRTRGALFVPSRRLPQHLDNDNQDKLLIQGDYIQRMRASVADVGKVVLFDIPYSTGMAGSPVFDREGQIQAIITGGVYVSSGSHARLARAIPVSTLARAIGNANKKGLTQQPPGKSPSVH